MKYTSVYFVRHAQTDWNAQRWLQGHADRELDATGQRQASAVALPESWRALPVFCSPLRRTQQTATRMGMCNYMLEPALKEMDWGQWEGCSLAALRAELGAEMTANEAAGLDFRPAGGESPREGGRRVCAWLALRRRAPTPAVAVSHKGVIRVAFATAWQWDMCGKPPYRLDWGKAHQIRIHDDGSLSPGEINIALNPSSKR